jgi:uncharacterized Fe-S cluster protein YjdI
MANVAHEYTNGEITIVWRPWLCTRSTECFVGLPEVFAPEKRPWVNPHGASTERIIAQIERCPTGALSYRWNNQDSE